MVAIRRASWRQGPANGWHDDLVWYAAAIGQMKALTPRLDEAQQLLFEWWPVRRDADGFLTTPPAELVAIIAGLVRPAEPRIPVAGARHPGQRRPVAQASGPAGVVAGVRPRALVLPAVAPGLPRRVRSGMPSSHRGARRSGPRRGDCRTGTPRTSSAIACGSVCRCHCVVRPFPPTSTCQGRSRGRVGSDAIRSSTPRGR